jgi:hypothetical protein
VWELFAQINRQQLLCWAGYTIFGTKYFAIITGVIIGAAMLTFFFACYFT